MNRKADPIATDAMQPLETLPVFYPLEGKRVLVIGGGEGAAWKADLVAATGARVEIFTSSPCARVKEISETRSNVSLHLRSVHVADFANAILANIALAKSATCTERRWRETFERVSEISFTRAQGDDVKISTRAPVAATRSAFQAAPSPPPMTKTRFPSNG